MKFYCGNRCFHQLWYKYFYFVFENKTKFQFWLNWWAMKYNLNSLLIEFINQSILYSMKHSINSHNTIIPTNSKKNFLINTITLRTSLISTSNQILFSFTHQFTLFNFTVIQWLLNQQKYLMQVTKQITPRKLILLNRNLISHYTVRVQKYQKEITQKKNLLMKNSTEKFYFQRHADEPLPKF